MPRSSSPGAAGRTHGTDALEARAQAAQLALGARHDPQLVALAIEGVERVDGGELDGRQPEVVARELRNRLQRARQVVAEGAEQAAGEGRRPGRHVGPQAVEQRRGPRPARRRGRDARARRRATARGTTSGPRPIRAARCRAPPARAAPPPARCRVPERRPRGRGRPQPVPGSSVHGSASAWARAPAATPSRSSASNSGAMRRRSLPSRATASLRPRGDDVSRIAVGGGELCELDRPLLDRQSERRARPPGAPRGRRRAAARPPAA